MMVSRSFLDIFIFHPYWKYLITAGVVCLLLAHLAIRKIVDITV
jgi:hypothetical protein